MYCCDKCSRFIRFEKRKATKELLEAGYPEYYNIPICSKCGELPVYAVNWRERKRRIKK